MYDGISIRTLATLFAVFLALGSTPGYGEDPPDEVRVDMGQWYRRDWDECKSATRFRYTDGVAQIVSERSTGLIWQIPTLQDAPMVLDPEAHPWLEKCKRPPRSFNSEIRKQGFDDFIDVSEYRYITWRWKVDYSTIGEQRVGKGGKLKKKYDDFTAKIGISILKKDSDQLREVTYVWSNTLPESLMFKAETTIIPFIWKLTWRRFVAESGVDRWGQWIPESRDLYADYRKGYPGEEPGKIVRIYLMTDTDNTQSRASTSYADIVFYRQAPEGQPPPGPSEGRDGDRE